MYSNPAITILNVDADVIAQRHKSDILRSAGYTVIEAVTAGEAWQRSQAERPTVVILDMRRAMDEALTLGRQFKAAAVAPPILLLASALGDVTSWEDSADICLREPFTPAQFLSQVRVLVRLAQSETAQLVLSNLLEHLPEGITLPGGPPDFPILANSRLAQELIGQPEETLAGKSAGYPVEKYDIFMADGVIRHTPEQMPFYRATQLGETVSMEEALRRSEQQLALAAGQMGLWEWDIITNRLMWNEREYELLGLPAGNSAVDSTLFFEHVQAEDLPQLRQALTQAIEKIGEFKQVFRIVRSDGAVRWLMGVGRAFPDANGQPSRMVGIHYDITERKQTEEIVREANQRKDEFLAMLAHELRNPLAPIRNAVEILRLLGQAEPKQQWALDVIVRQVEHLTRLVDDLLDVSRLLHGKITLKRAPLVLTTLVQHAVEASRPLIEARWQTLEIKLPPEPVHLEGDLTRLAQVLANLLNNAAKYTNEGGHIGLEAETCPGEVIIRVWDTGVGMPASLLPHVFDLFTQAERTLDRSQGGLGLGLTVVKNLVELHGGRVEARSDGPGRGSEFTVRLPTLTVATCERTVDDGEPIFALGEPHYRILVVDDDADVAESVAVLLGLEGHEVRTVHTGAAALALARDFQPQVILLDLNLPEMDGYTVARRLRADPTTQAIPLLALTGYGQSEDRERSRAAGFDAYLIKPVDSAALQRLVTMLGRKGCCE